MEYDNTNRVALWKNDYKKAENHPDFRGTINVDGKEMEISLWKKTSDNPKAPLLSGRIQEPYNGGSKTEEDPLPF